MGEYTNIDIEQVEENFQGLQKFNNEQLIMLALAELVSVSPIPIGSRIPLESILYNRIKNG